MSDEQWFLALPYRAKSGVPLVDIRARGSMGSRYVCTTTPDDAEQIVADHNTHAALKAKLAQVAEERERYRSALEDIRQDYGKVCEGYMECTHASCESSYGAWATADAALALSGAEAAGAGE